MKVKFLSIIGSSVPSGLTTQGLPTRQARAVLFCLRGWFDIVVPPREFAEEDDTVEVFKALLLFSFDGALSWPGLKALITRSERALLLSYGRHRFCFRRHSSMPWLSSFKFLKPCLLPSARVKLIMSRLFVLSLEVVVSWLARSSKESSLLLWLERHLNGIL